ncbi:MAG: hypothetical protein HYW25_05130 [Candidatus Aenigmarchaeota archaeon]|nr:hypothetical protein [Candidatus Aenigmarchaeota archaeon]
MELRQRRINTAIFAIIGAVVGYLSFLINSPPLSLLLAIAVMVISVFAVKKIFSISEKKWWSSPVVLYITTWIVVWAIFFNIYIVQAPV